MKTANHARMSSESQAKEGAIHSQLETVHISSIWGLTISPQYNSSNLRKGAAS